MNAVVSKLLSLCGLLLVSAVSQAALLPLEQDNIRVFKQISPYVVSVHQLKTVSKSLFNSKKVATGAGSGFLWNRQGYVVTNAHVIGTAKELSVTLASGKVVEAELVAANRRKDIALLKLRSVRDLPKTIARDHIPLTDSDKLVVGQLAIAIGNPFGLSQTFTEGVVSALNRDVMSAGVINTSAMIQTDASINPGNSGGPLLNSEGQLIGMNTLIFSHSGSSSGIGFAIPANMVVKTVKTIIRNGKVVQPGIGIVPVSDLVAKKINFPGVIISQVLPNSPAAKAGLRGLTYNLYGQVALGDSVIGINGKRIKTVTQFFREVEKIGAGKTIVLHIYRNKKQYKLKIPVVNLS